MNKTRTKRKLKIHDSNLKIVDIGFISIASYTNRPLGRKAHKSFLSNDFKGADGIQVTVLGMVINSLLLFTNTLKLRSVEK